MFFVSGCPTGKQEIIWTTATATCDKKKTGDKDMNLHRFEIHTNKCYTIIITMKGENIHAYCKEAIAGKNERD
jgi:hypothetical protein